MARFQQAIAAQARSCRAHNNLGNVLLGQGKLDEAAAQFEQALGPQARPRRAAQQPGQRPARARPSSTEAAACYEQAIALRPNYAEAYNNLGNVAGTQGRFDEAMAPLSTSPGPPARPRRSALPSRRSENLRAGDPDLAALEALAADNARLVARRQVYRPLCARQGAGRRRRLPARAFRALAAGQCAEARPNRLRRSGRSAEFPAHCRGLRRRRCSIALPAMGDPSPVPIFVLGMPRSGSTLVEQILASHPQVHAAGELTNLIACSSRHPTPPAGRFLFRSAIAALDADGLRRLGRPIWPACRRCRGQDADHRQVAEQLPVCRV